VAVVSLVNSINDWQKEKQFQKLNAKKEDREIQVFNYSLLLFFFSFFFLFNSLF